MAVAFDAESTLAVGTGDRSWTHTPVAEPAGVLVLIVEEGGTDTITGVTYGGETMTEVALSPVLYAGAESGSIHGFFLANPADIDAATVAIDTATGSDQYIAACFTVTSATGVSAVHDTSIQAGATGLTTVGATLTISINSFVAGAMYSGLGAPAFTEVTGTQQVVEGDLGQDSGGISRGNSIKTTDFSYTWTQASDDGMALVVAICEAAATISGSFSANAVIKKTGISGSFTANAVIRKPDQLGSFTANAVKRQTFTQTFTANASITGFLANAAIEGWGDYSETWSNLWGTPAVTGNFSANAVIKATITPAGGKKADAVLFKNSGTKTFTADAIVKRTMPIAGATFTANAIVRRTFTPTLTVNAVLKRTQTGATTVNAVTAKTASSTFAANAVIKRTQLGSFPSDAIRLRTQTATFTANAVIFSNSGTKTFAADATVWRTFEPTFAANAVIKREQTGSFAANAVLKRTQNPTSTVDAIRKRTFYFGSGPDPR